MLKEPGRETPGDGISAFMVCQPPPFGEALGIKPDDPPNAGDTVTAADHGGAACSRLEKMVLSHDR